MLAGLPLPPPRSRLSIILCDSLQRGLYTQHVSEQTIADRCPIVWGDPNENGMECVLRDCTRWTCVRPESSRWQVGSPFHESTRRTNSDCLRSKVGRSEGDWNDDQPIRFSTELANQDSGR